VARNRTNQRAIDYVLSLGPDRVTPPQKNALRAVAEYWSERWGTANVELQKLSEDLLRHPRHLRRVFGSLDHLLDYKPGLGSGNYSEFRFLELGHANGTQRGHKGDIPGTAIKEEDLNLVQNHPPIPLSPKGGVQKLITVRQVRELRRQIDEAERRDGLPRLAAIEQACRKMLFPLQAAVDLFDAAGHRETSEDLRTLIEENPRKRPRRAWVS
jgi:hypothetical protein